MPSNFVDLNQAANMLGVSPEELVEMRSQGEIFGFRDGSSWKFKTDELERVAQERGISLTGSDDDELSLADESELDLSKPLFGEEDGSLAPDESDTSSIGELLAGDMIDLDSDDDAESLLVSDEVPLASDGQGGSTIIGANNNPDSDLQLSGDDDDDVLSSDLNLAGSAVGGSSILGGELDLAAADAGGSDVKLVPGGEDGAGVSVVPDSDELLVGPDGSGALPDSDSSAGTGDLELASSGDELGLASGTGDLELDSGAGTGDLELSAGSGTGDLELSTGSGTGDLELSVGSGTGELELDLDSGSLDLEDLDDDDELVLGDSSALGSDVTLGTGDTGINLTSPSDSGLSLEEDPIDIAGGPISSLELPDEDIISLEDEADPDAATQLKQDEAFLLSPGDAMEEDDSGSQVIALEDSAQFDQDAATMLGQNAYDDGLQAQVQQQPAALDPAAATGGMVAAGGAMAAGAAMGDPAADPNAAAFGAPTSPVVEHPREAPYTIFNVMALMTITGVLGLSGMLMMDVVRNMWSWSADKGPVSTSVMDGLLNALGIK